MLENQDFDKSLEMDELDAVDALTMPTSIRPSAKRKSIQVSTEEIAESPKDAPGSGTRRNQRASAALDASNALREVLNESDPISITYAMETPSRKGPKPSRMSIAREPSPELQSSGLFITPGPTTSSHGEDDLDELSPEQERVQNEQFSGAEEEDVEAEAVDDFAAAIHLQKRRKRRSSRLSRDESLVIDELDAEEEVSGEFVNEPEPSSSTTLPRAFQAPRRNKHTSPAAQRQPKPAKPKKKSRKNKDANTREAATGRETVIVPVHRLTRPIMVAEDETDADVLNAEIPFAKRGGVNAVDVLAEFCEETITSGLETLLEGGANAKDASTRREYRTKLRSVEAFQEEMRVRLLDLVSFTNYDFTSVGKLTSRAQTINLDANHQLTKRVRSSQLQIKHLREEVLRLRAEREKVAIRKDEIRIKHEESSKGTMEQALLNTAIQDIELAVERCKALVEGDNGAELQQPALSVALPSTAAQVSSRAPGGGLLAQVRGFNAFLERAALALEGRA